MLTRLFRFSRRASASTANGPAPSPGVVTVLHTKGGSGGSVIASGLADALGTGHHADAVALLSLDRVIERSQPVSWAAERHRRTTTLLVADCSFLDEQAPQVLDDADVVVFVMPTDPKGPDPVTGEEPSYEAKIPPDLRADPRLVVVVNDGAGPQGTRLAAKKTGGDILRVPFDERIAYHFPSKRALPAPATWDAFRRISAVILDRLRGTVP